MKRIALASVMLLALLSPVLASAAEIVVSPSAEATRYSWVVVDSRKLKVPLGVALAQLPGGGNAIALGKVKIGDDHARLLGARSGRATDIVSAGAIDDVGAPIAQHKLHRFRRGKVIFKQKDEGAHRRHSAHEITLRRAASAVHAA